ncbi:MAG: preprotein translocase subunit YajC [Candidatus Infernicultor aquiphilus]|uniref:Sec translocon accessory complex subunit YajC n=1 Tax=Candidatus Infernicultor aquiphilus TaxID=1805029 RepID=A0A2M7K6A4_9BACT|nr:preprotein translocase subunit YajC [bacterium]PIX33678.1 MAG: preprotein translocase subunit YajC [Candidatus Atribacteria bacterium CG_4_8_14_3_um_filter_34_18]PIY33289.1 MAG: preprotein translocase subunit YajC [Candidatus Atribacteria bacterium CG_4_10_14_3_um_filter_34_13]PJB58033.1 MAG: preprotein translocase subunit YajC [Candidatus Atribacteria bacterium CG_4_9_14_3_um_filter_33_16]
MQSIQQFLPLIIIFAIFYFILIRPQQQKQKKHKSMLDSLQKGDKVITIGGLYGIIREIKGDVLTLEIAKDVVINTSRSAIGVKREK